MQGRLGEIAPNPRRRTSVPLFNFGRVRGRPFSIGLPLEAEVLHLVGKGVQGERKVKEREAQTTFPALSSAARLRAAQGGTGSLRCPRPPKAGDAPAVSGRVPGKRHSAPLAPSPRRPCPAFQWGGDRRGLEGHSLPASAALLWQVCMMLCVRGVAATFCERAVCAQ